MDVLMPQLGETVAEGKITKWFKSAGDAVKPGDNLFEIETDKVSMEVPSTTAGMLAEIRVGVGEVAPVGAVVAVIAGDGAAARQPQAAPLASAPSGPAQSGTSAARSEPPRPGPALAGTSRRRRGTQLRRAARSVLRGAHARAQFRSGAAAGGTVGDAAGAAARQRGRHRSRAASRRRARTAASSRATSRRRPPRSRAPAPRPWRAARRPPR